MKVYTHGLKMKYLKMVVGNIADTAKEEKYAEIVYYDMEEHEVTSFSIRTKNYAFPAPSRRDGYVGVGIYREKVTMQKLADDINEAVMDYCMAIRA